MGMSVQEYRNLVLSENNKKPKYQLRGKVNHDLGKNFEERIESICEVYEMNNMAKIEKTPEPMKILKHIENGHFETIFTKSAQPDFKGTIKGGKTIVFDAKFTELDKINYAVLSDYQRETLISYKNLGAEAFVLVGVISGNIYKIDIDIWNNMKEQFGRKYIKEEELKNLNFKAKLDKNGVENFLE